MRKNTTRNVLLLGAALVVIALLVLLLGYGLNKAENGADALASSSAAIGESTPNSEALAGSEAVTAASATLEDKIEQNNSLNWEDAVMVEITMQDGGVIRLELNEEAAPLTVENFVNLVNDAFYDGLIFHRIIKDFMVQGGCPDGTGMGGPGYEIKGEFAANGWDNPISHVPYVISMARSPDFDSAGSQFFITHGDATFLDGQYAAFGRVVEGNDVVDAMANVATDAGDRPLEDVVIKTIRVVE